MQKIIEYVAKNYPSFVEYATTKNHSMATTQKVNRKVLATIRKDLSERFPKEYAECKYLFA